MPSRYPYVTTIRNEYLGVSKVIRAMSEHELDWLSQAQLAKWQEQEQKKKQQRRIVANREAAKQEAETESAAAQALLEAWRNLLTSSLSTNLAINWDELLDHRTYPPFQFAQEKPSLDEVRLSLLGPEPQLRGVSAPRRELPSFFEIIFRFMKRRRLERQAARESEYEQEKAAAEREYRKAQKEYRAGERQVVGAYNRAVHEYNARLGAAKDQYRKGRDEFLARQSEHNNAVLSFRGRYEQGSAEAVERYAGLALERSSYPDGISGETDVQFDEPSKTLVVTFWLPGPEAVPKAVEYKYVASRDATKVVEMKPKEFESFYDSVVHQILLRTVREVFVADYAGRVEAVVFNGWVRGTDSKTGQPFTSCIVSCEVSRQQFANLDLARVSPKECVRALKGVTAGPLAFLAPVRPVMELRRDDDRFVEGREVLEHLGSQENLAAMEWEDFEHLVRELFEKEFSTTGGEVRVTQASRDRGVDAIAFDPDPIRGGKFVIQAKRFNIVVPVSAVRDLYGTMIAEGASKGILVTTSYFGRDSREFAKDKPLTLIDGENLVYLFQKHGYNVQIELLAKGDPRRGL